MSQGLYFIVYIQMMTGKAHFSYTQTATYPVAPFSYHRNTRAPSENSR